MCIHQTFFSQYFIDEEARKEEADKLMNMAIANSTATSHIPAAAVHNPMMYASYDGMHQMAPEDYDDLMPDPMQFVSLMGAPPPPPMVPPPSAQIQMQQSEPVLPPGTYFACPSYFTRNILNKFAVVGIDGADADAVIKTISDAPLPRKGPLPQDFQDALSIIFPGEKKPDTKTPASDSKNPSVSIDVATTATTTTLDISDHNLQIDKNNLHEQHHMDAVSAASTNDQHAVIYQQPQQHQHDDSHSQMNMDTYGTFSVVNGVPILNQAAFPTSDDSVAQQQQHEVHPVANSSTNDISVNDVPLPTDACTVAMKMMEKQQDEKTIEAEEKRALRQAELNDLAMLGIDADDMAAQCIL